MFVELPFVKDFYESRHNYMVDFVGHPLLDSIADFKESETFDSFVQKNDLLSKKIIAVLPGSREYEVRENLKTMQEISDNFPDFQFVIAGMSRFSESFYKQFITKNNVFIVFDQTYELILKAHAAIVVSGTATLETALLNVPEVVVYQTNPFTFYIAKLFVKLSFLGLPNIIMNREIVPELLQKDMNAANLHQALTAITQNKDTREAIQKSYAELRNKLGNEGAAKRTAHLINQYLLN